MALSAFDDAAREPTDSDVARVLGRAAPRWAELAAAAGDAERRWNYSGAKFGWSLRLVKGDRIILYLTPQAGCVLAGLALGEKASAAALASKLPVKSRAALEAAPRYAEGRGVRIEVRTKADAQAVASLVRFKLRA